MTGSSAGISSRSTQRASRREGRGFATRYHVPIVATRTIRSAKPAATNNDAASDRNSFEVGKESAVLRIPSVLRITSNIPATANNRGQSAFTWLTISHLIETLPKRVARISESVLRGCRFPLNHADYRRAVSGGRDGNVGSLSSASTVPQYNCPEGRFWDSAVLCPAQWLGAASST